MQPALPICFRRGCMTTSNENAKANQKIGASFRNERPANPQIPIKLPNKLTPYATTGRFDDSRQNATHAPRGTIVAMTKSRMPLTMAAPIRKLIIAAPLLATAQTENSELPDKPEAIKSNTTFQSRLGTSITNTRKLKDQKSNR